jgi:hypothetical protein
MLQNFFVVIYNFGQYPRVFASSFLPLPAVAVFELWNLGSFVNCSTNCTASTDFDELKTFFIAILYIFEQCQQQLDSNP